MINITRVTIDGINSTIDIDIEGIKCFMPLETFVQETNCPFDIENVFFVAYEPDRNILSVERRGGKVDTLETIPEIVWIETNIEAIKQFARNYKQEDYLPTYRDKRNFYITNTDWIVIRHRDELDLSVATTITNEHYLKILNYRKYLRDLPSDTEIDSVKSFEEYDSE
jgi:hypothetical protein